MTENMTKNVHRRPARTAFELPTYVTMAAVVTPSRTGAFYLVYTALVDGMKCGILTGQHTERMAPNNHVVVAP